LRPIDKRSGAIDMLLLPFGNELLLL